MKEGITDPDAVTARTAEIKQKLADDAAEATKVNAEARGKVTAVLKEVFADWIAAIQSDIETDTNLLAADQQARDAMTTDDAALEAIDPSAVDARAQLDQFAIDHKLTPFEHQKKANTT